MLVAWGGIEPPTQGFSIFVDVYCRQALIALSLLQKVVRDGWNLARKSNAL